MTVKEQKETSERWWERTSETDNKGGRERETTVSERNNKCERALSE